MPDSEIEYLDVVVHVGMYAFLMTIFFYESSRQSFAITLRFTLVYALIFGLFGGVIELLQENFVSGRYGDWIDFTANTLGIVLSIMLLVVTKRIQKER